MSLNKNGKEQISDAFRRQAGTKSRKMSQKEQPDPLKTFFQEIRTLEKAGSIKEEDLACLLRLIRYANEMHISVKKLVSWNISSDAYLKRDKPAGSCRAQLVKCMELYNRILACSPKKNELYQQAFCSGRGILSCMRHFNEAVERELPAAESIEEMQGILWGNNLQFLGFALKKLSSAKDIEEESPCGKAEEYEKLLRKRNARLDGPRLSEIEEIDGRILKTELRKKQRRERYERIEQRLEEMRPVFMRLAEPSGWISPEQYEEKAMWIYHEFQAMLDEATLPGDGVGGTEG